ncbi:hypothetical protein ABT364_08375 [Massilia sp. SR12]
MLNERGDQFLAEIDAGVLDSATFTHDSEYKALGSRYRLVLSPKSLVLEDGCSLDVCIKFTKATPLCRNTSEYVLNISLNVHKFSPGHFESPLTMRLPTPRQDFRSMIRPATLSDVSSKANSECRELNYELTPHLPITWRWS